MRRSLPRLSPRPPAIFLLGALFLAPGLLAPVPALADWHATGRFFYRDREQDLTGFTGVQTDRPARRVDVQVLDANTSTVLATGATGVDGAYDVLVPDTQVRDVRVRALTSSSATASLFLSVRVSTINPQVYMVTSAAVTGHSPTANQTFGDLTALPEAGGEAFNAYDVALNGFDFLKVLNGSWPAVALVVYWSASSTDGTYFDDATNSVHLTADEGYDDTVIGHEEGHFASANYSKDNNPGGTHFIGDNNQDIRLSWSEGFATYFSCSVRRRMGVASPGMTYYIDTSGAPGAGNLDFSYEIEGPSRGAYGAASEVAVQALLWDVADSPATADPTPGVDDDPVVDRADEDIWEVMKNYLTQPAATNVSLEDFWDGWFRAGATHDRQAEMIAAFDALRVSYHDDAAENDDVLAQAVYLPGDGSPQARTFYPAGDIDWAWFPAAAGETVIIETTDLYSDANTTLTLTDSLSTQLAFNDNRTSSDASSRIVYTVPATGRYFVRAAHASDLGVYGSYDLRLFRAAPSAVTFTDVASAAGTANGGNGRGVAWADYDGDGWLDAYVCNIAAANALYRNQQNGTFVDRAPTAGVALTTSSEGACFGDYDNDGDEDLYVSTVGGDDALYKNMRTETGTATFTNVTGTAGITDGGSGRTVNWVDIDRDGDLDLFVANTTGSCKLWRNNGNGTFTDITAAAGFAGMTAITASWADYDKDGDDDVFLGVNGGASHLMRNTGGVFADVGGAAGVAGGKSTFAADWGDFDGDGWLDLLVADSESPNRLYRNLGNGTFAEVGEASGVASLAQSTSATFADHDLDGDLDLYVTNYNSANQLYDNVTGGVYSVTGAGGITLRSRAASWADYDRDGDPDLFVTTETVDALLRNDAPARPWLEVDLRGRTSNRDGVGAVLTASAGGRRQVRQAYAGQGFGSQNSLRVEFGLGLGVGSVDTLQVDWPSRKRSILTGIAVNQILLVDESGAVGVEGPAGPPAVLALAAPWPNPAGSGVTFAVGVPAALAGKPASLEVFSPAGRRVATVFRGALPVDSARVSWNLRDGGGARVGAGVYFAVLRAGSEQLTRKLVVLAP